MICFLDIDGVLHSDPCYEDEKQFCNLPLFENVVRDLPHVEIVISSTWRITRSLIELQQLFSPDIRSKIVGVTPLPHTFDAPPELALYHRHAEIEAWMTTFRKPWENWVALDDRYDWFKPFCGMLVVCDSKTGLTYDTAIKLERKLSAHV